VRNDGQSGKTCQCRLPPWIAVRQAWQTELKIEIAVVKVVNTQEVKTEGKKNTTETNNRTAITN
jgi:hypothetical protein